MPKKKKTTKDNNNKKSMFKLSTLCYGLLNNVVDDSAENLEAGEVFLKHVFF